MHHVEKNSLKAWILAARPKTLAAGSVPILVASGLAAHFGQFKPIPALLCLVFALLAQIASNFSNDYFDFIKKTDGADRLGPERAVSSGWIDPPKMLYGTLMTIAVACILGLGLIYYGGWEMIVVGAVCVLSLLAYSTGPWPLSYHGLGDLFVLVFFGFVAVVFSFYVQAQTFHSLAFVSGAVVGLAAVNIMIINNFRDRETDRKSHKNTTIVIFGEVFAKWYYLINGIVACMLCLFFLQESVWAAILPFLYLIPHVITWKKMITINRGKALNKLIGETSGNMLILGLLLTIGLLL
ncbi:MAG: 1,4-dihydroxy-2-naphthoate polyprenyltransferase [Bacteroidales bacterium]|nr:1,4-dihydroxy-2-naphthoate polyprenyltransferase [Bacteroidales bacterium]